MKNEELYVLINKLTKDYYKLIGSNKTDKNFKEFNEEFNITIFNMILDFIKLHQTIIEKDTLDYDICSPICEIGMNDDVYQVQLCAIGNKNLWIKEVESILITSLTKKS